MDLTDQQWNLIEPILPADPVLSDRRGRPWSDRRKVFNGILWILCTGALWLNLPLRYGQYPTVHRRFQNWVRSEVIGAILLTLAKYLKEAGGIDLKECFVDGTFVPTKIGGSKSAKPSVAKAPKSWALQTTMAFLSPC